MRIEDYWNDGFGYHIEFQVLSEMNLIRIQKNIITMNELSIEEVEKIIRKRFKDVQKILIIEEFEEFLIEKLG